MIFQSFNLFNSRTVFGNIAYPLKLAKVPKNEIKERVNELLKFVGLEDKANYYPEQLSGGQKRVWALLEHLRHRQIFLYVMRQHQL